MDLKSDSPEEIYHIFLSSINMKLSGPRQPNFFSSMAAVVYTGATGFFQTKKGQGDLS